MVHLILIVCFEINNSEQDLASYISGTPDTNSLRSIPVEISEKDIYNDLCERGFTPDSVIRLRRTRDKVPMPLVLVKIDKKHKSIYHLKEVLFLDVTVETLKSLVRQQGNVFVAKSSLSKSEPVTCANCGEEHLRTVEVVPVSRSRVFGHRSPKSFHPLRGLVSMKVVPTKRP
ncbi:zinc finger associated protein [Popillia japonica]|uniref:Zinc finger associated protein n=1 Tax=Popillia japonica TaxID=7064 RepID=A0AAW1KNI2_POPJA